MGQRIFHTVTAAAFVLGFINAGDAEPVEATTATPTVVATPTYSTPQISCTVAVDPAAPMVGDVVRIDVQRSSSGLGYQSYSLDAGTLFSGSTATQSTPTFTLEAIQAGTVRLSATTTDEFIIGYVDDRPIYQFAGAGCIVDVVVGGGPSPTPTPTDHTPAATPVFTSSPTPSFECHLIPGSVTIANPNIVSPLLIEVGAAIELRFQMSYLAYRINSIHLDGAAELFAIETLPSSAPTFRLTAIAPGTAMVRLIVIYGTEELCGDGHGGTYYRVGPDQTETSQALEIVVAAASTPTPTPTETVAPPIDPSPIATPSPTAIVDDFDCHPIAGSVSVRDLEIVPPAPIVVGAEIDLRFDASFNVYQVNSVRLDGASELFAGETVQFSGATFHLTAVAPGTAMVRLIVNYGTEEACGDGRGGTYYQVGPNQTQTSQVFEVVVTAPVTATPTPTVMPTSTGPDEQDGDSGCAIDHHAHGSIVLLAPLLITLRARRRRDAKHRTTPPWS